MSPAGDGKRGARREGSVRRRARIAKRQPKRGAATEGTGEVVERGRGVFMISVAAELADMHPQTLRMYEARGLITPKRSPKNTRLYSHADVERLRRIQAMTAEEGLNLAGVESVLELEQRIEELRGELRQVRRRAAELEDRIAREVEQVRRSMRAEIVPYGAYESEIETAPGDRGRLRIPVERPQRDDEKKGR